MMRLLKIEWAKLAKYRPFWWLFAFYLAAAPLFMLFVESFDIPLFEMGAGKMIYGFPMGWNVATYLSSWFHFLLGIIMVIFATNEFTYRTARQHVIDGLTRKEVFISKLTLTAALSIFSTFYTAVLAIIGSLIYAGGLDNFTDGIEYIPIFLFQTFGYLSIAFLVSFFVRSSGYAILVFLGIIFVEWILRQILGTNVSEWIAVFSPIGMISKLTPIPFAEKFSGYSDPKYILSTGERLMYGSLYILAYLSITYRMIMRKNF